MATDMTATEPGSDAFLQAAAAVREKDAPEIDFSQKSWSTKRRTETSWESRLEIDGQTFYVDLMTKGVADECVHRVSQLQGAVGADESATLEDALTAFSTVDGFTEENTAVLQKHLKMWSLPFPCNAEEIDALTIEAKMQIFMALLMKSKSGMSSVGF